MRKLITCFVLLLQLSQTRSQTILGHIHDQKNRPIAGASVALKDSYDGSVTDSSGKFSFHTTEKGIRVLEISAVGFKALEERLDLSALPSQIEILLKEEVNEMKAVIVTAGSFEAGDRKRATALSSIDMLTTASANADVTGAVKTLPGTQAAGEAEGLFVRGGTSSETKTYIDGTLVNNFFYSSVPDIAQRGRFTSWLFKGTVFSAGGYSALYGQALSGALLLETRDLPESSSGNLGISFIGGSAGIQKLNKKRNASWGLSYGYTNLWLAFHVLKQKPDYFHMPEYHSADANFRIRTSKTGMVKYYGYFSQNQVGLRNPSLDSTGYQDAFRLKNFNMYHNLSWREGLGHNWKMNLGLSYTNNRDRIAGSMEDASDKQVILSNLEYKNFELNAPSHYANAKLVLEKKMSGLSAIRFGSEYNYSYDHPLYISYDGKEASVTIKEQLISAFAETDIYLTNALAAKFGTRLEHSSLLNEWNLAPRLSLAYKTGRNSQASLAYGIFYQNPDRKYLPALTDLSFSRATHYITQYQKMIQNQTIRFEVYYKKYQDLIKTTVTEGQQRAVSNQGYGYARGFEVFYRDNKKTLKNIDFWISYSYLDTKRDFLNYPHEIQPSFAAKHTVNLVVKKFVPALKTQFNANYVFATGRPYYNFLYDQSQSKFNIADQGKTIPYNSLSFSVNYLPDVFGKGASKNTVFVFSMTNVLGSKQVFGYNYSYNGLRKEAIVPPARTFIYLGAFISFGVDRTEDVINNNL